MGDIHLNNTLVLVRTLDGQDYQPTANNSGFNELADLARKALKAETGVIPFAEEPSREYPVYLETPDRDLTHRIREGAISPDNPYYFALAQRLEGHINFPTEIAPPSPPLFKDSIFPAALRADPLFPEMLASLEEEIRREESYPNSSLLKASIMRRDAAKIIQDIIKQRRDEGATPRKPRTH